MKAPLQLDLPSPSVNLKAFSVYLIVSAVLFIFLVVYTLLYKPLFMALALVGTPLALVIVTHRRLALYQFVVALFIRYVVVESVPVSLADISAALVILAAVLDVFLHQERPRGLPRLSLTYRPDDKHNQKICCDD